MNGACDGGESVFLCPEECKPCGNGQIDDGEACDDGNTANNDACLVSCDLPSCGDGFTIGELYGDEECDDGGDNGNTKACTEQCTVATCGDGFVHDGVEECDEGPMNDNTAACTSQCKIATCGDGLEQAGVETCDDGNDLDTDACFKCQPTFCGDGIIQAPNGGGVEETCDDGNADDTDTCDQACKTVVHRKVFVSSTQYNGNLGGLAGADAKCQALAAAAGLTGTFKAWLSDGAEGPISRFDTAFTGVYELVDGTLVAHGWTDLTDGDLTNAVEVNEIANALDVVVWSNTTTGGEPLGTGHCMNWASASATQTGAYGFSAAKNSSWTVAMTTVCSAANNLYCFEDPA